MGECICKKSVFNNDWLDNNWLDNNCCNFCSLFFSQEGLIIEYNVRYSNKIYNFDCIAATNYKCLNLYKLNYNSFDYELLLDNINLFYSVKDDFTEIYNKSIKIIDNLCFL